MSPRWPGGCDGEKIGGMGPGQTLRLLMPMASFQRMDSKERLQGQVSAGTFGCLIARGEERLFQDVLPASGDGVTCHHECTWVGEYHHALG